MATINKSLTTYLPDESVKWLQDYCLGHKHLLNKEGQPKLGTAVADIIARLGNGELSLPAMPEPEGKVLVKYGTDIEGMKESIEKLNARLELISERGSGNAPSTVLTKEDVENIANDAIEAKVVKLKKP
jgi:hypothetical protein